MFMQEDIQLERHDISVMSEAHLSNVIGSVESTACQSKNDILH